MKKKPEEKVLKSQMVAIINAGKVLENQCKQQHSFIIELNKDKEQLKTEIRNLRGEIYSLTHSMNATIKMHAKIHADSLNPNAPQAAQRKW
jgi:hypothetical protein